MAEESVAQDQIKAFVERILRLKEESKAIASDIREIYAEAKGNGFDKTVLGQIVSYVDKRQNDAATLEERSALFDLYLEAFDGSVGRPSHAHTREKATKLTYGDHLDDATKAAVDPVVALRANPALAIVNAADLKSEPHPTKADGSDLTSPPALNGQVADIQPDHVPDAGNMVKANEDEVIAAEGVRPDDEIEVPDAGKSMGAPASVASEPMYAAPGVTIWEVAPPEGVHRHDYSAAFGELGQDIAVIEDDMANAASAPIVKIGSVILDGWARYLKARSLGIEYPVEQYAGSDPLIDCIRLNLAGRILTSEQTFRIAQALAKKEPKRKADIYAAFELGMELA